MAEASWRFLEPVLRARVDGVEGEAYIDSHTGGEPTRVLLEPVEGPDPTWPRRVAAEPRGSGILVGVALGAPSSSTATARLHFFNNVGPLRMCVHATIGCVETLARLWPEAASQTLWFETDAGAVSAARSSDGAVTVHNVESWWQREAEVEVEGIEGGIHGDVAWAGNWFFLCQDPAGRIERSQIPRLQRLAAQIRASLVRAGIDGDGAEIDHIHLRADEGSGPTRVFVLCPGGEYDRSPCGTGTAALTAVLAHRQTLGEGESLRVQSALGSEFEADYIGTERGVRPRIRGRAHITARGWLVFEDDDPFRDGL